MNSSVRLIWLFVIISLLPFFFIFQPEAGSISYSRVFGYIGLTLIWWQIMLGNRFVTKFFTRDLVAVNHMHKFLGSFAFFFVAFHYGLALAFYGADVIFAPSIEGAFNRGVKVGATAFFLIVGLWASSRLVRSKLSWDWWKRIHLLAYVIFAMGMYHSAETAGYSQSVFGFIQPLRAFLLLTFVAVVLVRVLQWAGLLKPEFTVTKITEPAKGVKRIQLKPKGKALIPDIGRFCYVQFKRFDQSHPFTVSDWIEESQELVFSIKASGDWTSKLHADLQEGDTVFIDGPYGVFTSELPDLKKPVVMIAGGIGITPFYAWVVYTNKVKHLFYGNQTREDIAYQKQLDSSSTEVHHVLSGEKAKGMQQGYVTAELIQKKIGKLTDYEYYLCGPPIMMKSVTEDLKKNGVIASQIKSEKFSL